MYGHEYILLLLVKQRIAFVLLHGHCFICVARVNVLCTISPSAEQDNHDHKWQTWKWWEHIQHQSHHSTNRGKRKKTRKCTHPSCRVRPWARSGVCWPVLPLSAAGRDGRPAWQTTWTWPARSSAWQLPWFCSPLSYPGSPRGGWPGTLSRERRWPPPGGWEGWWNQWPWIFCAERKTFTIPAVLLHSSCLHLCFHITGVYRSNSSVGSKTHWNIWWAFAIQCNNKPNTPNATSGCNSGSVVGTVSMFSPLVPVSCTAIGPSFSLLGSFRFIHQIINSNNRERALGSWKTAQWLLINEYLYLKTTELQYTNTTYFIVTVRKTNNGIAQHLQCAKQKDRLQ